MGELEMQHYNLKKQKNPALVINTSVGFFAFWPCISLLPLKSSISNILKIRKDVL